MQTSAGGRGGKAPISHNAHAISERPVVSKAAAAAVDPHRKKILLAGHKRAGKTACKEVTFHGLGAKETFQLEPTRKVTKENLDVLIPIQVWDCPANYALENLDLLISAFSTIIYVIDIQCLEPEDDYGVPIHLLIQLMAQVYVETKGKEPPISFNIFVHKAESMSEDYKLDYFRHLQERIYEGCLDHDGPLENIELIFHLTSVYDHTIYEAWSRVIQKLIEPLSTIENLMNVLCGNSGLTKAYLFDIKTLIHVAADESPPDAAMYGLCCEYVQTIMQFSNLYKSVEWEPPSNVAPYRPAQDLEHEMAMLSMNPSFPAGRKAPLIMAEPESRPEPAIPNPSIVVKPSTTTPGKPERRLESGVRTSTFTSKPSLTSTSKPQPRPEPRVATSVSTSTPKPSTTARRTLAPPPSTSTSPTSPRTPRSSRPSIGSGGHGADGGKERRHSGREHRERPKEKEKDGNEVEREKKEAEKDKNKRKSRLRQVSSSIVSTATDVFDVNRDTTRNWASSCVRLKPQTNLVYWEITAELALVCLVRSETYDQNQSLIDYNVTFFRKAIHKIVELEDATWKPIELARPPGSDTQYHPPQRSLPSF